MPLCSTMMRHLILIAGLASGTQAADDALIAIAEGAQPPLAYAVERVHYSLRVTIDVSALTPDGSDVIPSIGVAGGARCRVRLWVLI